MKSCQKCELSWMKCSCRPIWNPAWGNPPKFKIHEIKICPQCKNHFGVPMKERDRIYCGHICSGKANAETSVASMQRPEVKKKRADNRRGTGRGVSYIKRDGRHEHRIVAEQKLGRALLLGEIAHHDNENKRDNSPDNIIVLPSQSAHARIHAVRRWSNKHKNENQQTCNQ